MNNLGRIYQGPFVSNDFLNPPSSFCKEDFLFSPYVYIGKTGPVPWRPCFSTDQYDLNNLGRGSPKDSCGKLFSVIFDNFEDIPWRPCFSMNSYNLNNFGGHVHQWIRFFQQSW